MSGLEAVAINVLVQDDVVAHTLTDLPQLSHPAAVWGQVAGLPSLGESLASADEARSQVRTSGTPVLSAVIALTWHPASIVINTYTLNLPLVFTGTRGLAQPNTCGPHPVYIYRTWA